MKPKFAPPRITTTATAIDGHEELDPAVVARRDIARVERQHEDREEARREAADAVDRGVAAELEELGGEGPRPPSPGLAGSRLPRVTGSRWYVEWRPLPGGTIRFRHYTRAVAIPASSSGGRAGCSTWWERRGLRLGDDVPYRPEAWEAVERGELPEGDELAAGFFHLARVEERGAERRPPRTLPRRLLVSRSARSAARAAAPGARRRAAALPRRTVRRRAHARRRRPVALDADRRARRRRPAEASRSRGPHGPGRARGARARARAAPQAARHRSELALRGDRRRGARARRAARPSFSWPGTGTGPTAPRPRRTTGCGRGSSRRCSRRVRRSGSTAATSPPRISSGSRESVRCWRSSTGR